MIIIPLEPAFGNSTSQSQHATIAELQIRAHSAGLAGIVVPVWDSGGGRMACIAPHNWRAFFQGISLQWVNVNINKQLSW